MRRELAHSRLVDAGPASYPARITPASVLTHRTAAPHVGPRLVMSDRLQGRDVTRDYARFMYAGRLRYPKILSSLTSRLGARKRESFRASTTASSTSRHEAQ
jgi:hypothetical protein